MAPRPDDAEDPPGGEPRDDAHGGPAGPGDVDARWEEIVTQLRGSDPRSWSRDPEAEEAEDHFEPPDPGPVLGGDPLITMAWTAVLGAPVLLLVAVVLWPAVPTVVLQLAAAGFLVGVGLLLWRMPARRDDDEGPGAVV